jgi:hypothetical protein
MGRKYIVAFEKRVLRRIFRHKTEDITRGWRKLYNEEFHNLYSSPKRSLG